ncbi:RNase adapter RapZ [Sphaerisporangium sp. B11E5]|uniref:RapZ C-terminal domain-containing protein n=1 Tax=Sphaerisporangium sp. B11E5 TaxID=3153563 RepID=UPI00325D6659
MTGHIRIISFGYGHPDAPPMADLTVDTRRQLRNPHHDPIMRDLTGLDAAVRRHVLATPGATCVIDIAAAYALSMRAAGGQVVRVAIGCTGGRHRAVALAEAVAARVRAGGVPAEVVHRDVAKPLLPLTTHGAGGEQ